MERPCSLTHLTDRHAFLLTISTLTNMNINKLPSPSSPRHPRHQLKHLYRFLLWPTRHQPFMSSSGWLSLSVFHLPVCLPHPHPHRPHCPSQVGGDRNPVFIFSSNTSLIIRRDLNLHLGTLSVLGPCSLRKLLRAPVPLFY